MNEPATPPPTVGKMGPYTVFITPSSDSQSPNKSNIPSTSVQLPPVKSAPLVQPPPIQYNNSTGSKFDFFWDAVAKVQNAHSSLDEYIAHWFGLNQSKYQWALDDYYESKEVLILANFINFRTKLTHKQNIHPPKLKVCNPCVFGRGWGWVAQEHLHNVFFEHAMSRKLDSVLGLIGLDQFM